MSKAYLVLADALVGIDGANSLFDGDGEAGRF